MSYFRRPSQSEIAEYKTKDIQYKAKHPRNNSPKANAKAKAVHKKYVGKRKLGATKGKSTYNRVTSPSNPYHALIRNGAGLGDKGDT